MSDRLLLLLEGLAAWALICVGVAFVSSWAVALIVAGVLLLVDRLT